MDDIYLNGTAVRQAWIADGRTQSDIARAAGISKYRLNQIAKLGATCAVTPATARGLAAALRVTVEELMGQTARKVAPLGTPVALAAYEMFEELLPDEQVEAYAYLKDLLRKQRDKLADDAHGS